ncbi:MAG: DNA repair protein RecN (Recombination protein N) [Planctomycetota bacterium]|jgi:DNA repair protein RecN (Recombination protein N)
MLEEILVRNLLIMESLSVVLGPGLNVISGETGVGKSLLLSSVGLLLGDKLPKEQHASESTKVEGRFQLRPEDKSRLADLIEDGEEQLVIRVARKPGGTQRCYVNGSLAARKELSVLGSSMVDLHGQRDTQKLLDRREQTRVLDTFAETLDKTTEFASLYKKWQSAQRAMELRDQQEREIRDRLDLIRYQENELVEADVKLGELVELERQSKLLRAAEATVLALKNSLARIDDDDDGVSHQLNRAGAELERLAEDDPELMALAEQAFAMAEAATDLGREMQSLGQARDRLEGDPAELDERLNLLHELARKYRTDEAGMLALQESHLEQIQTLEAELGSLQSLDSEIEALEAEMLKRGNALVKKREKSGKKLAALIEAELQDLRMPKARFHVLAGKTLKTFDPGKVHAHGLGECGFLICANPGTAPTPLEETASGGELSRILLAMKCVLAGRNNLPLLIFDEIEAGVGPRLGFLLGHKLKALSRHRQVLCITHLPQIAAFADRHLKIDKIVVGKKTTTTVEEISGHRRLEELSIMLGGGDEKLARSQAKSLLAEAASEPKKLKAKELSE